jgi:hypothetical protein
MTALTSPPVSPASPRSTRTPTTTIAPSERTHLLLRARDFDQQAQESAESGDLSTAARCILQSLDCERRAGGLGPQVLQLIKPR